MNASVIAALRAPVVAETKAPAGSANMYSVAASNGASDIVHVTVALSMSLAEPQPLAAPRAIKQLSEGMNFETRKPLAWDERGISWEHEQGSETRHTVPLHRPCG